MEEVPLCWKSIWLYIALFSELVQIADVQNQMPMYSMPQMGQMPFNYFGQSSFNGSPMSNMLQFTQQMLNQQGVQRRPQETQSVTQQRQNTHQNYNKKQDEQSVSQSGRSDQQQASRRSFPGTGVAMPFPMMPPMPVPFPIAPVQYAVPGLPLPQFCARKPRPPNCPPCPPCSCIPCMPAFFSYCSPCHLKCRCKGGQPAPVPIPPFPPIPIPGQMPALPMAMPGANLPYNPAQVMIVPFPPQFGLTTATKAPNSFEDFDDDGDNLRTANVKSKKKVRVLRDSNTYTEDSDNELLVPILSYVGQNGKVKFKTPISESEASELLENGRRLEDGELMTRRINDDANEDVEDTNSKTPETVHVMARSNGESGSDLQVLTTGEKKRMWLQDGKKRYTVQKGSKSLVFSPTGDKKIANLSVTFQVI